MESIQSMYSMYASHLRFTLTIRAFVEMACALYSIFLEKRVMLFGVSKLETNAI